MCDAEQSRKSVLVRLVWRWERGGDVVMTTDVVRCGGDDPTRPPTLGLVRGEVPLQGVDGLGAGQNNGGCRERRCVEGTHDVARAWRTAAVTSGPATVTDYQAPMTCGRQPSRRSAVTWTGVRPRLASASAVINGCPCLTALIPIMSR